MPIPTGGGAEKCTPGRCNRRSVSYENFSTVRTSLLWLAAAWLALTGCTPTGNASLGSSLPAWMQKALRVSPADSSAASSAASSEASSEMAASSLPASEQLDPGFGVMPSYDAIP